MMKLNLDRLDILTDFPKIEGINVSMKNGATKNGMAFDDGLIDVLISITNDVGAALIVEFIIRTILPQRDDRENRTIRIENLTINVNSISDAELNETITKLVEDKLKQNNDKE